MEDNKEEQATQKPQETVQEEAPKSGTNWITILIVIIILVALGYFAYSQFGSSSTTPEETRQPTEMTKETEAPEPKMQTYTMEEVSLHNSSEDCWLVLHDMVYDVTGFDTTHPGGEAILLGCGTDATELFEERPTDGSPHSNSARDFLPNFYIGDLPE